jgi:Family of unknown function (DUF6527)
MTPKVELGDKWGYFLFVHDCKEKDNHSRYLPISPDGWQFDPLSNTVTPSIQCLVCNVHGFWTNGEWRPC